MPSDTKARRELAKAGLGPVALRLAVLLLAAFPLASCARAQAQGAWRFTFVTPLTRGSPEGYWASVARGVQAASRELGASVSLTGSAYEANAGAMIQAVEEAILAKVDGIVTMALDPGAFRPVIDKAVAAGIPVVLVDTDAPESRRLAYVGTDNYAAGREAAKAIAASTSGRGKIGIISGAAEARNLQMRILGFSSGIAEYPGLKIVDQKAGKSELLTQGALAQAMLEAHPDITALFGVDGFGANASAMAVEQSGLGGKVAIVGFDYGTLTAKNLNSGLVSAVIVQDGFRMGYEAIETLASWKRGVPPPRPIIYIPTTVGTAAAPPPGR
jgi:ribose transport system substrate-binding protein